MKYIPLFNLLIAISWLLYCEQLNSNLGTLVHQSPQLHDSISVINAGPDKEHTSKEERSSSHPYATAMGLTNEHLKYRSKYQDNNDHEKKRAQAKLRRIQGSKEKKKMSLEEAILSEIKLASFSLNLAPRSLSVKREHYLDDV